MIGVDENIVGSAGDLQVAFRLQLRGGLVIDDLVGAQNVIAVVDHHPAGQGPGVAHAALVLGLPLHRHTACGLGLQLSHGQNLLARVVRQSGRSGIIQAGLSRLNGLRRSRGCRIGQRLRPHLQVTEGHHRDKH